MSTSNTKVSPIRKKALAEKLLKPKRTRAPAAVREGILFLRIAAAAAAAFLPVASYVLAHFEAISQPGLWVLVAAGLAYSAPTLAEWAVSWCQSRIKAWGFTILLEGVMVASKVMALSVGALVLLLLINGAYAWWHAGKRAAQPLPQSK